MPDFQFNSFPINATPLADVSENTSADGVLVVRNGAVQKVPKASAAHAIGALDSTDLEPYVEKEQTINNYPLNGDVVIRAVDVPFTPTAGIESDNVQNAIVEAVGFLSEAHETSLYVNAGTTSAEGNYALSGDIDDYDFLDIYTSFSGLNDIRRIPVEPGRSYCLRFLNLANTDTSTFVEWSEILLSFSDAVMTVAHNKCVNWNGKVNSDAVVATSGKPYVIKVMGIKYDLIGTQGGGTIVVDNALSPNSTNPVQNKTIYQALQEGGLSNSVKIALLNCFANVAWIGPDGQTYYDALYDALYPETPPAQLVSITAAFDQTGVTIYTTDTLDDLKPYLTVTAEYDDSTTEEVTNYVLSGTLTVGTSTITVSYGGMTDTFDVTVTHVIQQYVTDGLVMRLDGIDNTGNGHDASATTWKDLVGSYDISVPANSATWADDGLVFAGAQNRSVKNASTPGASAATIEMVVEPGTGGSGAQIMAGFECYSSGATSRQFMYYSDNSVGGVGQQTASFSNTAAAISDIRTLTFTYSSGATVAKCFVNGTQASSSGTNHGVAKRDSVLYLGNKYDNNSTNAYYGKIMAVRYYNRILTDDEILQNHAVDVDRFNLVV